MSIAIIRIGKVSAEQGLILDPSTLKVGESKKVKIKLTNPKTNMARWLQAESYLIGKGGDMDAEEKQEHGSVLILKKESADSFDLFWMDGEEQCRPAFTVGLFEPDCDWLSVKKEEVPKPIIEKQNNTYSLKVPEKREDKGLFSKKDQWLYLHWNQDGSKEYKCIYLYLSLNKDGNVIAQKTNTDAAYITFYVIN